MGNGIVICEHIIMPIKNNNIGIIFEKLAILTFLNFTFSITVMPPSKKILTYTSTNINEVNSQYKSKDLKIKAILMNDLLDVKTDSSIFNYLNGKTIVLEKKLINKYSKI